MEPQSVAQLILQLLSERSPEFGARLKQRLDVLLLSKGLARFDQKAFGYQKFSSFISHVLRDRVLIQPPSGSGDILVSLRAPNAVQGGLTYGHPQHLEPASTSASTQVVRSDVWQAFTNPDPKRKRLFNRESRSVQHFVVPEPEVVGAQEVQFGLGSTVEIERIHPEAQASWMKEFLDSAQLPSGELDALKALIAQTYSSALNAAFTRALGQHGVQWRHFRTSNVMKIIRAWAAQNEVPFADLCVQRGAPSYTAVGKSVGEAELSHRERAAKLLDLLSNEDISQQVIPTLLNFILIKTRSQN